MEISFHKEIEQLRLGQGAEFRGEGILAVTKALLQSGVAYIGGYQGAPVSHLLDVAVQARDYLRELGVHVEACANEAAAAALLGASINYPLRGAVTWKSIVGTNVASDALSNLASAGVVGGTLIVVGEDYGEGASVIQERTHAFALKSTICLLDPRPNLPTIVRLVENAFELSEASSMPVMMELRIRACHVYGSFPAKDNRAPPISRNALLAGPPEFLYDRLSHPPATFRQEKLKSEVRLPAARKFILERRLNEVRGPDTGEVGIIVQGGLYNGLLRALQQFELADSYGRSRVPLLVLNAVYPLVPEQIARFCAGKRAVLVLEEGQPEFIEQEIATILRRLDVQTALHGKDFLPMAGEYTAEVMLRGLLGFLEKYPAGGNVAAARTWVEALDKRRQDAAGVFGKPLPPRPPTFCVGCPERPVFAALKLVQREIGPAHVSGDIGCHAFATFEPFSLGNSILGYGMSLASAAAVTPMMAKRPVAIMGDGGFWHNGLLSGVAGNLLNKDDGILVIMKNGYSSATGTQEIVSSPRAAEVHVDLEAAQRSQTHADITIEKTLKGMGVQWLRTVHTYRVSEMMRTLREAFTSPFKGLKVIVAEGECQLERQRRIRPLMARLLQSGKRVVRVRYGVDEDVCTGDHACIRLSGCPSLTIKKSSDPLKLDPVATVNHNCVGCGLCGEVAEAATLCPSFYRAEIVQNPSAWERLVHRVRGRLLRALAGKPAVAA
ncbi:MAG TPA: indolepyruvate ferredoxin oxidoreductase subunit alpha [Burkholderiales bacterium]